MRSKTKKLFISVTAAKRGSYNGSILSWYEIKYDTVRYYKIRSAKNLSQVAESIARGNTKILAPPWLAEKRGLGVTDTDGGLKTKLCSCLLRAYPRLFTLGSAQSHGVRGEPGGSTGGPVDSLLRGSVYQMTSSGEHLGMVNAQGLRHWNSSHRKNPSTAAVCREVAYEEWE